ncbi:hypothetical protein A4X06_0g4301 [Tilletia controversa]|uniref:P-loop containing nucleoside triphosphate hydrolase protein n=1 Tax=Tilletia controversa TaxID=13291 RepID=A0A8X7MSY1_9BASI|nr:hypothetical protein CF328_g3559 [Tilletia controversa]KAE8247639.1 hypothetical protein A4X06_0g4301 [Tilletia controversa]
MNVAPGEAQWETVVRPSASEPEGGDGERSAASPKRPIVLICCGLVGSGKSTVACAIQDFYPDVWVRCNQDELRTRQAVESNVHRALRRGQNVIVDRTNADASQRQNWTTIAQEYRAEAVVVIFDTPFDACYRRLQVRTGHPTLKSAQQATDILARFARQLTFPPPSSPGIDRTIIIPPSTYSVQPTQEEIDSILDRIEDTQNTSTPAEVSSAQLRARPSPGFPAPLRVGQAQHRDPYRQQQLPYGPRHGNNPSSGGWNSNRPPPLYPSAASASSSSSSRPYHLPPAISARDNTRSYASASNSTAPLQPYSSIAVAPPARTPARQAGHPYQSAPPSTQAHGPSREDYN